MKKEVDIDIDMGDYKVYVFDLDNTLDLHYVDYDYKQEYTRRVQEFLEGLYAKGKIICLATHNNNPHNTLVRMGIYKYFQEIVYENKKLNPDVNTVEEYTSKGDMVLEIMHRRGVKRGEIIFFDDLNYNVDIVKSLGVHAFKVSPELGIEFSNHNF